MSVSYRAMLFAREIHKEQRRKYTNDPYFAHLAEVAGVVATIDNPMREVSVAVAYLHDSKEDQGVSHETLIDRFGIIVAEGVDWLSDLETGNRAARKAAACARLARAPAWVQTIKCADIMSNTASIALHDPKFFKVYAQEIRGVLSVLDKADPRLWCIANEMVP